MSTTAPVPPSHQHAHNTPPSDTVPSTVHHHTPTPHCHTSTKPLSTTTKPPRNIGKIAIKIPQATVEQHKNAAAIVPSYRLTQRSLDWALHIAASGGRFSTMTAIGRGYKERTADRKIERLTAATVNSRSPHYCERRPIQTWPVLEDRKPAASPLLADFGIDVFPSSPLQWMNALPRREKEETEIRFQNWVK
ncbi:Hypothetical predicted protein [Olea europaea subsp. europaea]|uniref:Uncharacterized protein n=1 Tax=Olea europaea subsp. europaea TaxID=158383 RepID=A0A8S0SDN7_OLEEU|nr:Hypothetical predicted protein [Olea europaea subsp. europaea]